MIIFVNKRLLLPKSKGGYGLQGLASTLTCWHYICTTSLLGIAAASGFLMPKRFPSDQTGLRWFLIFTIAIAPLSSNFSLLLNTVATYQLSKILQTPVSSLVDFPMGLPLSPELQVVAVAERFYEGRRLSWQRIAALAGQILRILTYCSPTARCC